jgi:hypothetical protein
MLFLLVMPRGSKTNTMMSPLNSCGARLKTTAIHGIKKSITLRQVLGVPWKGLKLG